MLYDGLCGFCDGSVQFVLAHDRQRTMRFAPLQGQFAAAALARQPTLRGLDSIVLIEQTDAGERVWVQSDAVLRIAEYLGGRYRLARVLRIVPRFLRNGAYALFARYRYRLFGRLDACALPPANVRSRFID